MIGTEVVLSVDKMKHWIEDHHLSRAGTFSRRTQPVSTWSNEFALDARAIHHARDYHNNSQPFGYPINSTLKITQDERGSLEILSDSANLSKADRALKILLLLARWTSADNGEAFGVHEDTVRHWYSTFSHEGLAGIKRPPATPRTTARLRSVRLRFLPGVALRNARKVTRILGTDS